MAAPHSILFFPFVANPGLFKDNVYCHIASGLGAGFFAVCVGSPVDVVKSRMMGESFIVCVPRSGPAVCGGGNPGPE